MLYNIFALTVLFPATIAGVVWIAGKLEKALYILGAFLWEVKQ